MYFQELAYMIMEDGKSNICRKSQCCSSSPKVVCWQNSLLLRKGQSYSIQTVNWLDEAHPQYGGQSVSLKVTALNINLMQKHPYWDFPGGTVVKNLPANAGGTGSIPCPGRSHMPRSN